MSDERALLMAIPLRHLESATASPGAPGGAATLPAGGPGDLDAARSGMPLIVIATDAGDAEVPAATWRATFVRRTPYEPFSPWPDGLPRTWVEEHPEVVELVETTPGAEADDGDDADEWDDEDDVGPQSFLEVIGLSELPRDEWLFTNELVRKQARGGRSYRPRVPTLVDLPD